MERGWDERTRVFCRPTEGGGKNGGSAKLLAMGRGAGGPPPVDP